MPIAAFTGELDLNKVVDEKFKEYNVDKSQWTSIQLPSDHSPYLGMRFWIPDEEAIKRQSDIKPDHSDATKETKTPTIFKSITLDPNIGETLNNENQFELADFLYKLHYNLSLPQGLYIVGFITLFFLVLIFTGIVIQLKNLVKHFFLYRKDKSTRYKMKDLHNVIGVISLPYGLIYAITGLMLNLSIIAQIPTVLILYDGNLDAAFKDTGFINITTKPADKPYAMPDLKELINRVEADYNVHVDNLNFFNYGDENAVIRIRGEEADTFAGRFDIYYQVKTDDFPDELNLPPGNVFKDGTRLLYNMHFANFAGLDVRFIYFLLAIGVCMMIVAGNVLWMAKRVKNGNYPRTMAVMRGLTIGGCAGVMPATAVALLMERILFSDYAHRVTMVEGSFGVVLLFAVIIAAYYKDFLKYLRYTALITGAALGVTVIYEWLVFGNVILELQRDGFPEVAGFSIALAICSAFFIWLGRWLMTKLRNTSIETQDNLVSQEQIS
jgi:hypothetical protein